MRYIIRDGDGKEVGRTVEFDSAEGIGDMRIRYTQAGTMEGIAIYPRGRDAVTLPLVESLNVKTGAVLSISLDSPPEAE